MHHTKDQGTLWNRGQKEWKSQRTECCEIISLDMIWLSIAIMISPELWVPAPDQGINRAEIISRSYLILRSYW